MARWLAAQGAGPVALDLSGAMLRHAATANRRTGIDVPLVQADATALPFASESFDMAVSAFGAIAFVADPARVMQEVFRVLRPGGVALVSFHIRSEEVEAGETWHLTSWFGKSVDLDGHYLDPEVVMAELLRVGFDVGSVTTRMPHPGIEVQTERAYLLAQKPERPPV